jgi:hypothetical protein
MERLMPDLLALDLPDTASFALLFTLRHLAQEGVTLRVGPDWELTFPVHFRVATPDFAYDCRLRGHYAAPLCFVDNESVSLEEFARRAPTKRLRVAISPADEDLVRTRGRKALQVRAGSRVRVVHPATLDVEHVLVKLDVSTDADEQKVEVALTGKGGRLRGDAEARVFQQPHVEYEIDQGDDANEVVDHVTFADVRIYVPGHAAFA